MNMESYICIVSIYIFYEKKGEKKRNIATSPYKSENARIKGANAQEGLRICCLHAR